MREEEGGERKEERGEREEGIGGRGKEMLGVGGGGRGVGERGEGERGGREMKGIWGLFFFENDYDSRVYIKYLGRHRIFFSFFVWKDEEVGGRGVPV